MAPFPPVFVMTLPRVNSIALFYLSNNQSVNLEHILITTFH